MPGQFPISKFLADKLSAARGSTGDTLSPERPLEAQVANLDQLNLDFDQTTVASLKSPLLPDFIDPRTGLLSSGIEERNQSPLTTPLDAAVPERQTRRIFVCDTCGKSFNAQGNLNMHNRRHDKNHCCKQCDWRFSEARDLRRHVQSVHQQHWEHCSQCGKTLKKRGDNIRRHMMRHCPKRQQNLGN
ncbi:hypothetical protein F5Y04DRAFT_261104 [Hypomontagnella monticulosa]|nr:hypothetical protein F5Y04DRAFT_261104 [Hypomontagnella monticulosa]